MSTNIPQPNSAPLTPILAQNQAPIAGGGLGGQPLGPNERVPGRVYFGGIPTYDEGTAGQPKKSTRLQAKPTGGFMNSLREVLGDLGDVAQSKLKITISSEPHDKKEDKIPNHAAGTIGGLDYGNYGTVTQDELIRMSRQAAGPGARSVIEGSRLSPFQIPGLQTPTPESLANLSGAELQGLNTNLAAEFNSTLDDLMHQINLRYKAPNTKKARFMT